MNDENSLSHTSWNCKYHVIFAPKYRRKVFHGEKRREIGEILRTLRSWKKDKDHGSGNMPGPYPYAHRNPAKGCGIELHGIPQREKQPDDI